MKIRKNASKKIAALIDQATQIISCSQSLCMHSDCYEYGDDVKITADQAKTFYKEKYADIRCVWLETNEQGEPVELRIDTWKTTLTFTFGPVEPEQIEIVEVEEVVKPRLNLAQVAALRAKGFVSPLSHAVIAEKPESDQDKQIVKVTVRASEASTFNRALRASDSAYSINATISPSEYHFLASRHAQEQKQNGWQYGYDKTFLTIETANGEKYEWRHDLNPKNVSLQQDWARWVDQCRAEHERKTAALH